VNISPETKNRLVSPDGRRGGVECTWLSCFSRWARILLLVLLPAPAAAQISPGELSRPHTALEGPLQCVQCHSFGAGRPQLKCLGCHTEIRHRITAKLGYHARAVDRSKGEMDCARCHSEHNGGNFDIVRWPATKETFDHHQTGYSLEGKHLQLACQQCHQQGKLAAQPPGLAKNPGRTFLGLSTQCVSCHKDVHGGQLETNCARCHTAVGWKPATLFNHERSKYPLTGRHERIVCEKCHRQVGEAPGRAQYKGLAFSDCTPCHNDPHKGAFTTTCRSCHDTAGWRQTRLSSNFDHQRTHFPLKGKHESVACAKCHKTTDFNAALPHAKCRDCHQDWHRGQFRQRQDQGDCAACHSENGFKPSSFTAARHKETAYPLEGNHSDVSCEKCHLPARESTNYHPKRSACLDCHKEAHEQQFVGQPHRNRCESCHTVGGFHPSTFTVSNHRETRFALVGAHLAVACTDCHKVPPEPAMRSSARFHFTDIACVACHRDPHRSQLSRSQTAYEKISTKQGCEGCHSTRNWKIAAGFDHEVTGFSLTGAHRLVDCIRCHHSPENNGSRLVVFEKTSKTCSSCHKDVHAGQFRRAGRDPDCAQCHTTLNWRPSVFDHEKDSAFSLAGAHQKVACRLCHLTRKEISGESILFYGGITKECSGCHN